MKRRISPRCAKPSAFGTEGSAGLPNLPNLPFSESGSQSNTNSEATKSIIFRIGTIKHTLVCLEVLPGVFGSN